MIGKPCRNVDKPFVLTDKEIARATKTYDGRLYTIVSRPNNGTYFVGAVWLDSGYPADCAALIDVPKSDIGKAVKEANRWMDKLAQGGKMSYISRHRNKP